MANINSATNSDKNYSTDVLDDQQVEVERPIAAGAGGALGALGGAALGMVAGPVGAAIGAVVGGLGLGLLAKDIADLVDPEVDSYWTAEHAKQPYAAGTDYQTYRPAYQYGAAARSQFANQTWEQASPALRDDWTKRGQKANLTWEQAEPAMRNAYNRPRSTNGSTQA